LEFSLDYSALMSGNMRAGIRVIMVTGGAVEVLVLTGTCTLDWHLLSVGLLIPLSVGSLLPLSVHLRSRLGSA
jgi:hypothetical protein